MPGGRSGQSLTTLGRGEGTLGTCLSHLPEVFIHMWLFTFDVFWRMHREVYVQRVIALFHLLCSEEGKHEAKRMDGLPWISEGYLLCSLRGWVQYEVQ